MLAASPGRIDHCVGDLVEYATGMISTAARTAIEIGSPLPETTTCIISHLALTHRMTNSKRLATVRARLLAWLAAEQSEVATPENSDHEILRESILIRNEFYCGRRFHTATHHAVWFIEERQIKFFDKDGHLVKTVEVENGDHGRRVAVA